MDLTYFSIYKGEKPLIWTWKHTHFLKLQYFVYLSEGWLGVSPYNLKVFLRRPTYFSLKYHYHCKNTKKYIDLPPINVTPLTKDTKL